MNTDPDEAGTQLAEIDRAFPDKERKHPVSANASPDARAIIKFATVQKGVDNRSKLPVAWWGHKSILQLVLF